MAKKKKRKRTHKDLEGFEITINPLGELESTMDIDEINAFLDKNVDDKKLSDSTEGDEEE